MIVEFIPNKKNILKASKILADAFCDYPLYKYIIPDQKKREKYLYLFYIIIIKFTLMHGEIYTDEKMNSVCLWTYPGQFSISITEFLLKGGVKFILSAGFGTIKKMIDINEYMEKIQSRHVLNNTWYLLTIGVACSHQSKGLASGLIRPFLKQIEEKKMTCYLETFKKKNVSIYKKFGFELVQNNTIPGTDLHFYAMMKK